MNERAFTPIVETWIGGVYQTSRHFQSFFERFISTSALGCVLPDDILRLIPKTVEGRGYAQFCLSDESRNPTTANS